MATALLVIDMQNAYFNNSALEKDRDRLTAACNELIISAQQRGVTIFNIRTEHTRDKATWTLNMLNADAGYLYEGDDDALPIDGLITEGVTEVVKIRDSAFFETSLLSMLRMKRIDHVVMCGVSTHSCILMTAADAYAANIDVTLAREAIATHDTTFHEPIFTLLKQEYRQENLDNQTIIAKME